MKIAYKILVADDNELMRELLAVEVKEILNNAQLTLVSDGLAAKSIAMKESFDLIVSDNIMPGLLGSKFLREIRDNEGPNEQTPFIFCSGNFSDEEIRGLKGCVLLQKPFDLLKLQNILQKLFPL